MVKLKEVFYKLLKGEAVKVGSENLCLAFKGKRGSNDLEPGVWKKISKREIA